MMEDWYYRQIFCSTSHSINVQKIFKVGRVFQLRWEGGILIVEFR
jgi:hypothetical protein